MQITTEIVGGVLELRVQGRLDNEAADDLLAVVDDVLRKGHHTALLDLREVDYLSSAGIGALMRAQKRFQAIQGVFGIAKSSPQVSEVLQLTKLARVLVCDPEAVRAKYDDGEGTVQPAFTIAADGVAWSVYQLREAEKLRCRTWGDPGRLIADRPDSSLLKKGTVPPGRADMSREVQSLERDSPLFQQAASPGVSQVSFPADTFGLGIGAFGRDEADCADRLGEFVAVAGGVAVQPTPEGGKPDYQFASGGFVPQPHVLYGLSFAGKFSRMIRFESEAADKPAGLSSLVSQCVDQSSAAVAGIVIVAESAGLIGARLRRSPVWRQGAPVATFAHPEVRNWFSFAAEHIFPHSLAVVAGIASRGAPQEDASGLARLVRPLGPAADLYGHFHAAVFSYRPLKKRRLNLQETVLGLFDREELQGVLHLLCDDRAISGSGESQFVSGACWVGPIAEVAAEGKAA